MPHVWNHFSGTSEPIWQKDNDIKSQSYALKIKPKVLYRETWWILDLGRQGLRLLACFLPQPGLELGRAGLGEASLTSRLPRAQARALRPICIATRLCLSSRQGLKHCHDPA